MLHLVKSHRKPLSLIIVISTLFLSLTSRLQADGYHYQIQTTTRFLANHIGVLSAVSVTWTYPPKESTLLLAGKDLTPANKEAALKQLGKAMLDDLFEFGYYSQLSIDGQPTLLNKVQDYAVSLASDQRLSLNFKLPLKTVIPVSGKRIALRLVDPDGVASLAYSSPQHITLDGSLAKTCSKPSITEEIMTLPNDHKPTVQSVQISCP